MPAPGVIGRLAARGMLGVDAEELNKAVESITAQSEEQVQVFKELEERRQLEERAERENLPKVYILKEDFRKLDPAMIHEQEDKYHCVLIPAEEHEIQRMKEDAVPYTMPPPMPKIPEIVMLDNPHRGKHGGNKTPRIEPKDYRKKKKAKRRAEKQARRRRN